MLTSTDLHTPGGVEAVAAEPRGGAHRDPHTAAHNLEQYVAKTLRDLKRVKPENLLERRYAKFRALGEFTERNARATKFAG
jgi:acetyl-CoA carboxylase carboxyl transferase subunit alpha